ncbi:MAG: iron-containing alcohol dehydrogenase [Candidatus Omnitrophica bacterium]|nr:iron-containing alcohol dehydrogenase [Candidatus Omnitrophota bacterium]MCM8803114.1 iron-containing alcohol dehydrogenase [Candidatus Omnitrophota bacterium]
MNEVYFYCPTRIYFERNAIEKYLPVIKNYGQRVLIVSGKNFIYKSGLFNKIRNVLENEKIKYSIFSEVEPEPDTDNVEKGVEFCKKENCDVIVAIGGGSALDVGKCIAVRSKNKGNISDYFGEKEYKNEPLPVIAIPTTCGTGSEVTRYAVIVNKSEKTKKTVSNEKIMPKVAILDPNVLEFLPPKLIAATGMDAFSHAVESYLSINSDFFSKLFAIESLKLIKENIKKAVFGDKEAKEKLFIGSIFAGYAINRTGTIIIHGIGYSLTIKYHTHHGTANALFLPYVLEFMKENGYEKEIEEMENIIGPTSELKNFITEIGLPVKLREIGVKKEDIEEIVDLSIKGCERAMKRMKFNLKEEDFLKIITSSY